jgi:hypothetical protein
MSLNAELYCYPYCALIRRREQILYSVFCEDDYQFSSTAVIWYCRYESLNVLLFVTDSLKARSSLTTFHTNLYRSRVFVCLFVCVLVACCINCRWFYFVYVINKLKVFQLSTFQLSAVNISWWQLSVAEVSGSAFSKYYDRWFNPMNSVGKIWLSVYGTIYVGERVFRPVWLLQYLQKKKDMLSLNFSTFSHEKFLLIFLLHYRHLTVCQTNSAVSLLLSVCAGRQTAVLCQYSIWDSLSGFNICCIKCSLQYTDVVLRPEVSLTCDIGRCRLVVHISIKHTQLATHWGILTCISVVICCVWWKPSRCVWELPK